MRQKESWDLRAFPSIRGVDAAVTDGSAAVILDLRSSRLHRLSRSGYSTIRIDPRTSARASIELYHSGRDTLLVITDGFRCFSVPMKLSGRAPCPGPHFDTALELAYISNSAVVANLLQENGIQKLAAFQRDQSQLQWSRSVPTGTKVTAAAKMLVAWVNEEEATVINVLAPATGESHAGFSLAGLGHNVQVFGTANMVGVASYDFAVDSTTIDLFNTRGCHMSKASVPVRLKVLHATGNWLLASVDLNRQLLVVYEVGR